MDSQAEAEFSEFMLGRWPRLVPLDPDLPHWTVFELAGHFDISIGLTRMLIDGRDDSQPARDRASSSASVSMVVSYEPMPTFYHQGGVSGRGSRLRRLR